MARHIDLSRTNMPAFAIGAAATGAFALAALALGAVAIGWLAVGGLAVRKARFRSVEIDDLTFRRLRVIETGTLAAGHEDR
jgi:hypothetical protein